MNFFKKAGKAISKTAAGGGLAGAILGGPVGAVIGAAASKEGKDFLKRATTIPKGMDPSKAGKGERERAQTLAQEIGQQYTGPEGIATKGIERAQAMQAPALAPTQQATGVAPMTLQERIVAPTLGTAQAAEAAPLAPAAQISPGFQQYIAGLAPEQMQAAALQRTAAAGPALIQAQEEGRSFQQALAQQLMGQATGQAPSLAELQLQQAQDRALKQQIAQAASVRGGPAAAAQQRQLGAQLAETQQAQMAQAAEARIKEQQAAQQTLGQVSTALRGADVDIATEQARLEQQAALEGRRITSDEAKTEATMLQEARRANQTAINDLTRAKAELTLRAQQGDQQAANELAQVEAKLGTEVNLDNARRIDDLRKEQARLTFEAQRGNQQAGIELQKLNAQLELDMQKFNASEANEMAKADADIKLKYEAMKNDLVKYYTSLGYDAKQAEMRTMIDIATQKSNAAASKFQQTTGIISGIGSAITGMTSMFGGK